MASTCHPVSVSGDIAYLLTISILRFSGNGFTPEALMSNGSRAFEDITLEWKHISYVVKEKGNKGIYVFNVWLGYHDRWNVPVTMPQRNVLDDKRTG